MRLAVDRYRIITDKPLEHPLRVVLISDVHISRNPLTGDFINIGSLLKNLRTIKNIDLFALCGDFVNSANTLKDLSIANRFADFLRRLSRTAPVVLVRGNHDLYNNDMDTEKIYQNFAKIPNVTLLDNAQMDFAGITITGFTPRHEAYDLIKHGKRSYAITVEDYKREHFQLNHDKFHLILTHSPYTFTNKRMQRELPEIYESSDLVLSGHLHNGLFLSGNHGIIGRILDDTKLVDLGFWVDPKTGFTSRHCRGAKFVGEHHIGSTILPASRGYTELRSSDYPRRLIQITGKGINKFSTLPFVVGRPSVAEIVITQ